MVDFHFLKFRAFYFRRVCARDSQRSLDINEDEKIEKPQDSIYAKHICGGDPTGGRMASTSLELHAVQIFLN